ncbi:ActS/PrrB/RegB family redox-sensitive histidine kinase [Beijerinckia sp. L45]|uniref:ActS/PrrB/RegB family redox-sensitive histidine kinase n=1 Tax=Beijerinckia sp. L45 TaxID=1641855 RepID=UPI00131C8164|nr:ActS/PrrB/RegB family redox-sensitive histidine kinase [Beijerinckia sp. L45]
MDIDLGHRSRRPRVDTLVRLRWLAVSGQAVAVLTTYFILGFALPLGLCCLVIAASIWVNVGLRIRFSHSDRLEDRPASYLMSYDLLQLTALLYLTGGLENPFAMLFMAPIMISAVSLSARYTAALTALVIICATSLLACHYPVPWYPGPVMHLPFLYTVGVWGGIVLGASFTAAYAWRVAEEARRLADALAATELVLVREQHLTQLDGLAAAAAHELGTPLATIKLVVKDLQKQFPAEGAIGEDFTLLMQEVERCRKILGTLASLGSEPGEIIGNLTLGHLLEEVVQPQRDFGIRIAIQKEGGGKEPVCRRNPGMLYGIANLVENAIDFAQTEVRLIARWTDAIVAVVIEDDGPGFAPDVMMRLGEPYVTRKANRRAKSEDGSSLGLGLFIAKTLLERAGASVSMTNAVPPLRGARVTILWQRSTFERRRTPAPVLDEIDLAAPAAHDQIAEKVDGNG